MQVRTGDVIEVLMPSPQRKRLRRGNLCRGIFQRQCSSAPAMLSTLRHRLWDDPDVRFRNGLKRLRTLETNCLYDNKSEDSGLGSGFRLSMQVNLQSLRERYSDVTEIVCTDCGLIFALTRLGACPVFDRLGSSSSGNRVCYLNIAPDDTVRSLFYNRARGAIISISVFKKDDYRVLRCRSTPLEHVRRGEPERGVSCFVSEELKYPGFIEFDAINARVLTFAAQKHTYKLWDLATYECLFAITDTAISNIKISPGALLVIYNSKGKPCTSLQDCNKDNNNNSGAVFPIKVLSLGVSDGDVLHERELQLKSMVCAPLTPKQMPVEVIEYSGGKILFKQSGCPMQIINLNTDEVFVLKDFVAPDGFIFLEKIRHFLIFRGHIVSLYNFHGECVSSFEDHVIWFPDAHMNNVFISNAQDVMISYCRNTDEGFMPCSINVSDIRTGQLLAKVAAPATTHLRHLDSQDAEPREGGRMEEGEEERGDEAEQDGEEEGAQLVLGDSVEIPHSILVSNLAAAAVQIMEQAGRSGGGGEDIIANTGEAEIDALARLNRNTNEVIAPSVVVADQTVETDVISELVQAGVQMQAAANMQREKDLQDGLRRVTCITYDEINGEILTGNALGQILVWGH